MIGGIVWRGILVLIAIITIGLQMDRQTQRTPVLAERVPQAFRSSAQYLVAARALGSDDHARALEEARRLVERRPLPAEHLRILAQAQIVAGQADAGTLTIQYAAQRGWRDPLIQEAQLRLAIEAGDTEEAARRYAALFLRRDTEDSLLTELGEPVFNEPGGAARKTLIAIVSGGERWGNQFLGRGSRVIPPDAYVEMVRETVNNGTQYDCEAFKRNVTLTTRRDEQSGAELNAVFERHCPSAVSAP